jgi:phosphoribosylformimino-5-aminoimidazole carboxamide ribonucleotide (ProFAR) isomerase
MVAVQAAEVTGTVPVNWQKTGLVAAVIYTDISRDGVLDGPNIDATLGFGRSRHTDHCLGGV